MLGLIVNGKIHIRNLNYYGLVSAQQEFWFGPNLRGPFGCGKDPYLDYQAPIAIKSVGG